MQRERIARELVKMAKELMATSGEKVSVSKLTRELKKNGAPVRVLDGSLKTLADHKKDLTRRLKKQERALAKSKEKGFSGQGLVEESIADIKKALKVVEKMSSKKAGIRIARGATWKMDVDPDEPGMSNQLDDWADMADEILHDDLDIDYREFQVVPNIDELVVTINTGDRNYDKYLIKEFHKTMKFNGIRGGRIASSKKASRRKTANVAKRAAAELAKAFNGQMYKDRMSQYGGYQVSFEGVKAGPDVTISVDEYDVTHMGGAMTGDEERLARGIARRFGLDWSE